MRYSVVMNGTPKFSLFSEKTLDREMAERLARDAARTNGKIMERVTSIAGNRFTAIMRDDPASQARQETEYQLAAFNAEQAGLPLIIGGIIVLGGTIFVGAAVWNWTIESATELTEATTALFDNPLINVIGVAIIGYLAVEVFRKWSK